MNTTDYDKIVDDLHRKSVAERMTVEDIANAAARSVGALPAPGYAIYDAALLAVRIARGEVEIP